MNQNLNNSRKNQGNDEFYRELDQRSSHKSCCTCQTMAIFFVILAIMTAGTIFYLYWQITHGGIFQPTAQVATISDFNKKIDNPQVTNSQVTLVLADKELNAILNNGLSISNFLLKDIVASINPKEILIYGNMIKPLSSKVVITCVPTIENGKIKLNINNVTAGNLNIPNFINLKVADSLNSVLDQKMASFYQKYEATDVYLDQNQIIIKGKIKI